MSIHPGVMGFDISKDFLDIFDAVDGSQCRVPNLAGDVAQLARRCANRKIFVLFEATGHYDKVLRHALSEAGKNGRAARPNANAAAKVFLLNMPLRSMSR